ncbi:hypothetical protein M9458_041662 [Cirrhinus mrigala]|uniref:Uncharacterized protein n=1 Tax=Cirrhinus mrigala TaxID=683832 RepID=A0ABD0NM07_CIRMR
MTEAEDALVGLWQGGRRLERYVEDFLELTNQLNWHDAALGACFQLGLDNKTIHCDLPVCEYPLIELINLILYLKGSNFEVEEIREDYKSRHPEPSGTRRIMPAHSSPGTPTCRTNGSDRLPSPKYPHILQGSICVLSPEPPAEPPPPEPTPAACPPPEHPPVPVPPKLSRACVGGGGHIPELPDPPWPPGLCAPPWLPELPDPPWLLELPDPPWLPEFPDPPWLPELPDLPWRPSRAFF